MRMESKNRMIDLDLETETETEDIAGVITGGKERGKSKGKGKGEKKSFAKSAVEFLLIMLIAYVLALLLTNFIIINGVVPTQSMLPQVEVNNRMLGNRLKYVFSEPERGDVVVFNPPDSPEDLYLKRVIGVPGDVIEIRNGKVWFRNDENRDWMMLDEPYLAETKDTGEFGPYEVPEDCFFMLGDNRTNSIDARFWSTPYVNKKDILGEAVLIYFPKIKMIN